MSAAPSPSKKKPKDRIEETLHELFKGELIELRAMGGSRRNPRTASGYFYDYAKAAEKALELEQQQKYSGVYVTLNRINEACYARAPELTVENPDNTTKDSDIVSRRYVLIDADCNRPAGISANPEEVYRAGEVILEVRKYLQEVMEYERTLLAFSGNGWHILVPVPDYPKGEVVWILSTLASEFDTSHVHIDRAVHNLSRITKLYGTVARKGFSVRDRQHRRSIYYGQNDIGLREVARIAGHSCPEHVGGV